MNNTMKLEQQVVSLELAKQLKESGVKQDSLFYWYGNGVTTEFRVVSEEWLHQPRLETSDLKQKVSAFTVAELGEMLPKGIKSYRFYTAKYDTEWECWYADTVSNNRLRIVMNQYGGTEADARAKMLIWLIDHRIDS